jgi:carbon monoxide dehydrogenase subunit G
MELSGDIWIGAPRPKVWSGLNDAEILVRSIPGCESMEVVSPTERAARVMVKVGPVRARFTGHVRMEDIRPGEGCTLHFEGSGGPAGMAKGHSAVSLSDEDGGTRLRYTVQASVGGKLGQVGGRMIDAAAKQMADQFFTAFNAAVGEEAPVAGAAPAPTMPPEAPTEPLAPVSAGPAAAASSAAPAAAAPTPRVVRPPAPPAPAPVGEGVRILWFALGALSTGFGVWIASLFSR